jgi:hypothetical protein
MRQGARDLVGDVLDQRAALRSEVDSLKKAIKALATKPTP